MTAWAAASGAIRPRARPSTASVASAPGRVSRVAARNSRSSSQARAVPASPARTAASVAANDAAQQRAAQRAARGREAGGVARRPRPRAGVAQRRPGRVVGRGVVLAQARAQCAAVAARRALRGLLGRRAVAEDELGLRVEEAAAQRLRVLLRGRRRRPARRSSRSRRDGDDRRQPPRGAAPRPTSRRPHGASGLGERDVQLARGLGDLARRSPRPAPAPRCRASRRPRRRTSCRRPPRRAGAPRSR